MVAGGWGAPLCCPATPCKFPNAFRSNECKVPNHASHCEWQLSGVCLCYGSASTYSTTVCLACGTRLTCRRTLRGRTCGPAGETTTGETMLMKAVASSRLRFLAPTRFALLLSTLAVLLTPVFLTITAGFLARGQSPDPPSIKVVDLIPASLSGASNQDSEPFLAIQNQNPQVMVASAFTPNPFRSEEHTSELQSQSNLVCRLLLEKKKTHKHYGT